MIPSQFYPTVSSDYFPTTGNTIEVTGDIRQQSDFAEKYVYPYLMGYIKTSNIPVCFRIPRVIFNTQEKTITAEYAKISDEYSDFLYSYPETNVSSSKVCMTIGTLPQYSKSIKCFNSLAPLQCYSNFYNKVISFETLYLDETEDSPVFSGGVVVSTTSAQQTINFINGTVTIQFVYRISGDTSDRTKSLSLNDFDSENGVHKFTITENNVEHTIYIFIVNVIQNFTYYYDANGVGGATNYIVNATQATIHYIVDDGSNDNDYVITTQPIGGYRTYTVLEVARSGTGYSDILQDMQYTINGYSRLLHFELDNFVYGNLIQNPNVVFKNGNTFISYYRSLTSYVDFYIIRGWTPNDVRFYLAMFPALSDGTESGRYLPRIVGNELTGEFFNYYAIDYLGTEWQKSKEIADNEYKESDKPKTYGENIRENGNLVDGNSYVSKSAIYGDSNSLTSYYDLSSLGFYDVANKLSQTASSFWEAIGTSTDYKQTNILDYIVSLRFYPFPVHQENDSVASEISFGFGTSASITLSSVQTYPSYELSKSTCVIDLGNVEVPTKQGSDSYLDRTFLDFEPYTKCKIYLPYYGIVDLKCSDVIGRKLLLKLFVDLVTGMGTYYLDSIDVSETTAGKHILTLPCKVGCEISVSGNDIISQAEKVSSAYIGATLTAVNRVESIAKSIGSGTGKSLNLLDSGGNASSVIASFLAPTLSEGVHTAIDIEKESVNIASARREVPEVISQGSGYGNTAFNYTPRLIVERPALLVPATYGHETGYPLNQSKLLGNMSGFVVCDNPDLSGIDALEEEKNMIYKALTNGVYF